MIFLYALIFIVIASLAYLFFAPFFIEVDSRESIYRIRFHRLASLSFFIENDLSQAELKFMIWKKRMNFLKISSKKKEKPEEKKSKSKSTISFKRMLNVLKSFKLNHFLLSIDTGDMQTNGILYPAFYWLSVKSGKDISINFEGKTIVAFEIENSIARMSRAYFAHS